ncbi:MAG: hypothetical protein WC538_07215 [Thermoanaerobaculia bacterium]
MALSVPAALVSAQYRASWNRILRTAGVGGEVATWITLGLVVVVLFFPGLVLTRIGLDLGAELATSGDTGVLDSWNGLIAVFTLGFAILGGFRSRPSFPSSRFGRYPLRSVDLLIAELPAGLFEVFPLLATGGLAAMNLGLAVRMPRQAPIIALLALLSIATMLGTMFIASAFYALVARSRLVLAGLIAASAIAAFAGGLRGVQTAVKEWLPALVDDLPIARGYEGLVLLRAGDVLTGAKWIAVATLSTALLLAIAATLQRMRLAAELEPDTPSRRLTASIPIDGGSRSMSTLFLIQLLSSRAVLALILIPLLYSVPIAVTASMGRAALAEGTILPPPILMFVGVAEKAPLFAIFPLIAIALNAQIWMNQFGWDRKSFRTFLLLPLEPREILTGRLRGLLLFTSIQTLLAVSPLLAVRMPGLREIVAAVAAGGVALIVTTGVGHVLSILHPRAVDDDASAHIPLHLSWISPITLLGTVAELAGVWFMAESVWKGTGVVALVLSLAAAISGYRLLLPRFSALLLRERERLLSM